MRRPRLRPGFTLTELLVVTAILMTMFGLVVTGAGPSRRTDGDIRRGAQQLASLLLASQSSSLGSPTGAAVIIDSAGALAETISHARRFPFIEGRVVAGMPPLDPTAWQVQVQLMPTNDSVSALQHGYRVRFLERTDDDQGPPSDWFSFVSTSPPTAEVRFRVENGQTSQTTVWPAAPESGDALAFQVARYPIPNGLAEMLPDTVAIDLRHSGYGDETMTAWKSLADRGAIAVGFDKVGTVDALMQNVLPAESEARSVQPLTPADRIYFLVTAKSDVLDPTVNALANEDALWVVINPRSGNIAISPNVPQTTDDAAALRAARDLASRGVTIGG
jgi:type II secretory pathway pseudopilin PulG